MKTVDGNELDPACYAAQLAEQVKLYQAMPDMKIDWWYDVLRELDRCLTHHFFPSQTIPPFGATLQGAPWASATMNREKSADSY